jgi:hypothetical protein
MSFREKAKMWLLVYIVCFLCMGIGFHMGRYPAQKTINESYLQGYKHWQTESLPSPGIDLHKKPNQDLLAKG